MLLAILSIFIILLIADYVWKRRTNKLLENIPGPLSLPFIGVIWLYFGTKPDELLKMGYDISKKYGRVAKMWVFHINAIFISDVKYMQAILSHPTETKKNRMYSLLDQWLGEGLLTSHGPKWLSRRRAITPAFHFKILENFISIFDQQARICAHKLNSHAAEKESNLEMIAGDGKFVLDIEHYIALATLDVICQTAMGVKINAQTDEHCEYVQNIIEMQNIFLERFVKVAYRSDILMKIFSPKFYARYQTVMKSLHSFTERIIQERRKEMLNNQPEKNENVNNEEENAYGKKNRMALLDILLSSAVDGNVLSDADIREEVDTFMFEGHDTTKSGIGFTLYALSRDLDVQQKLYEELQQILGTDLEAPLTYNKLMDLKYMEKVIKESLRMYPPVPFIGRQIMQDICIGQQRIPRGTSILLGLITMQNDPAYFEDPHKFLPDREVPKNSFVFVPFSAGPRNCIGQRFAMLEMKAFIVRILQLYELLPLGEEVKPTLSIVLKSKTGWQMGLKRRQ